MTTSTATRACTSLRSFATALRAALRQDPDVLLVGEMRDTETIDIALKASETGHLVLSTVHTTDASRTINRLVSVFNAEEQTMVRLRLADSSPQQERRRGERGRRQRPERSG